jgi:hypothetical protein
MNEASTLIPLRIVTVILVIVIIHWLVVKVQCKRLKIGC